MHHIGSLTALHSSPAVTPSGSEGPGLHVASGSGLPFFDGLRQIYSYLHGQI